MRINSLLEPEFGILSNVYSIVIHRTFQQRRFEASATTLYIEEMKFILALLLVLSCLISTHAFKNVAQRSAGRIHVSNQGKLFAPVHSPVKGSTELHMSSLAPVKEMIVGTTQKAVVLVKTIVFGVLLKPFSIILNFLRSVLGLGVKKGSGRWPPMVTIPPSPKRKMSVMDLSDKELKGKVVLVRCDLNVPLSNGRITDDTRIRGSVPTIKYLVKKGAKVMLTSHLGRPKDGFEDKFSLAPVAPRLTDLLGK